MFPNSTFNHRPQFNPYQVGQQFGRVNIHPHRNIVQQRNMHHQSIPYLQPGTFLDIGDYVPPLLTDSVSKWPSPEEVNASYERGSTVIRQQNNSMIDDYYKKFTRPLTDYIPIQTNGPLTYIYQELAASSNATKANETTTTDKNSASKKHKKKHKNRSSKSEQIDTVVENSTEATVKTESDKTATTTVVQQQVPPIAPNVVVPEIVPPKIAPNVVVPEIVPPKIAPALTVHPVPTATPKIPMRNSSNPVVFLDIEIDGEQRGRFIVELFRDVLPKTSQNFLALSTHARGFGYRSSYFHRIIPGFMAQGGDFENSNGTGGYSIYGEKFDDEKFFFKHDKAGLLSMANTGPNTNGSQFFITLAACPHLNNKHVVFGQVLQGFHILNDLDMSGSNDGGVIREVKIANCGQLQ